MRTRRGAAGPMALLLPLLVACGGDAGEAPPPSTGDTIASQPTTPAPQATGPLPAGVTAEMVQQGREIFHGQGICFTCHGQEGQGSALAPAMNDGTWLWVTGDGDQMEQIETIIRTGVSQPKEYPAPMPPMGGASLSEDQLRSVAAYVYSLNSAS